MGDTPVAYIGRGQCDDCGAAGSDPPKLWRVTELGITYQLCNGCLSLYGFRAPEPRRGDDDE